MENNTDNKTLKSIATKPPLITPFIIAELDTMVVSNNDLYRFNGRYYEPIPDTDLIRYIYLFYLKNGLDDKYSTTRANEILAIMKVSPQIATVKEFDVYDNIINLENGILDLDTMILSPHSPQIYTTYSIDVPYDSTQVDAPIFTRFIQGLFAESGNWEEGYVYDEKMVENTLRLCGYLLYPKITKEGLYLFIGTGSNGKSVLCDNVLRMFFGNKFISSMNFNIMGDENSKERTPLLYSRVNICAEEKGGAVASEEIKRISSGQYISVHVKYKEYPVEIKARTKLVALLNNMLYFNDTSNGIFRRLFMFHFKNQFVSEGQYAREIDPTSRRIFKKANVEMLNRGFQQEKSAILNIFLDALYRFKNDGWEFVDAKNLTDLLEEYKEGADTVGTWLLRNYKYEKNAKTRVIDLYSEFREYYDRNFGDKKFTYSMITLSKRIKDMFRIPSKLEWVKDGERRIKYTIYEIRKKRPGEDEDDSGEIERLLSEFAGSDINEDGVLNPGAERVSGQNETEEISPEEVTPAQDRLI
jgi:putative DNA primase/helicase